MLAWRFFKVMETMLPALVRHPIANRHNHSMHLYGTSYDGPHKGDADNSIVMKILRSKTCTLTALLVPVSMTGYPTFRDDDLHTLTQSDTFHIDENEILADIRCSCLTGGRFCLSGTHWLLEYDVNSKYWLDEHGHPRTGALARYNGQIRSVRSLLRAERLRLAALSQDPRRPRRLVARADSRLEDHDFTM